MKDLNNFLIN